MSQIVAAKVLELMRWLWRQARMPKLAFHWLGVQGKYLYLI